LIPYTQYFKNWLLIYNKEQWKVMVKVWVETGTVNYETGTIIWGTEPMTTCFSINSSRNEVNPF
jgi:hypothetical protein